MIRDENKRMRAGKNVLRISKLEKKELEISKESNNIHEVIEEPLSMSI
jgi:two-component system phosphate regulon sensor histidine kinase PhoR